MNIIEVKNVTKIINEQKLLDNISFSIEKGKICGVIGHNGSGKSVLFKHIAGLMIPSEGSIVVDNVNVSEGNFVKNMGVILDCTGFLSMNTAFENLKIIASINNEVSDEDIVSALEKVKLDPNNKTKVSKYSQGMKQRLAIAQAIMEKPDILLLDEPMNALDSDGVELVRELLLDMNKKDNVTILITSHIREDIEILCDVVYRIERGILTKE